MTTSLACLSSFDQMLTQLVAKIRNKHRAHIRDLTVDVGWGGLTVRGLATSYYGKQLAYHEVARHCGLPVIANEIEVRHAPAGEPRFSYDRCSLSESASRN